MVPAETDSCGSAVKTNWRWCHRRLNQQDGWCYPITQEDTDWLYNMASGVWFNQKTEKYCQGNTAEGFVYGVCQVDRTGQMYAATDADVLSCRRVSSLPSDCFRRRRYFLPDTAAKNSPAAGEGSDPASSGSDPASSPSPTKPEQLEDEEAAGEKDIVKECASPADSPTTANMLTMF